MTLFLDPESGRTNSEQLFEQLRSAIRSGRLRPGDQLIPSRAIAADLGISRSTVTAVYGRLSAEGYVEGRAGGGTVVSGFANAPPTHPTDGGRLLPHPRLAGLRAFDVEPKATARYDLRPGVVDSAQFPMADWRRCVRTALEHTTDHYADPCGSPDLRAVLARWITRSRGVHAEPDQVVVTSGTGHGVDLIIRVLTQPGERVCMEDPGYPPIHDLFRTHGLEVCGAPVDAEGIVIEAIPDDARFVFVTPSHQFPLGVTMSRTRRRQLLQWARDHDAAIIEDDYDSEFRRTTRPMEPLQLLDHDGRVIYVDTFSKSLSPALRIGFMVAPRELVAAIRTVRQYVDWCPPPVTDAALLHFIVNGHLDRHLRRTRTAYRNRYRGVLDALARTLPDGYAALPSDAGMHIAVTGAATPPDAELIRAMRREDLLVGRLRGTYRHTEPQGGVLVGFGGVADEDVPAAIDALSRVLGGRRRKLTRRG